MILDEYYEEEVVIEDEPSTPDNISLLLDEFRALKVERDAKVEEFRALKAERDAKVEEYDTNFRDCIASTESEYEEQVIEKWFQRDEMPDDLHSACLAMIAIVYKEEDVDAETMMKRTPLPDLYKYLKQHLEYKTMTNEENEGVITEATKPEVDIIADEYIEEEILDDITESEYEEELVEDDLPSHQVSLALLNEFKAMKVEREKKARNIALSIEPEYEEQVIEKWFGRDEMPEDLASACMAMIPVVYKGEDVDVQTMMRRTPLPDLYKYLKQQLEYKQLTLKREQSRAMPHKQERVILEELVVEDNVSEAEEVIEEEEIIEEEIDEEYIEEYIEEIE